MTEWFVTYNDVSSFDKLKARLPNNDVYYIYNVAKNVEEYPVAVGSFTVVRESQPGGAKPDVVIVRQCHEAQPGNVPTIWRENDRNVCQVFKGKYKKFIELRCDAYL